MPLGTYGAGLGPYYGVILPVEKTNLISYPSFERGTTGIPSGQKPNTAVGSTSETQAFGAISLYVTLSSNGTSGITLGSWASGNGTTYTASAYVNAPSGVPMRIAVSNSNGINYVGSVLFTGGGTWHRYAVSYTETIDLNRRIAVTKAEDATTGTMYLDGVMAEVGNLTTYIDGDQEGCLWLGAPHESPSSRDGQSRAGGSIVALADLGFQPDDTPGIGMPPVENNAQSYALLDGAQFQRQRAAPRTFTLAAQIDGDTQQTYHARRRALIDAVKADLVTPQQPTRFVYIGAGGTSYIDAVYAGGLEGGDQAGFSEVAAAQFTAYDPYWRADRDIGTTLAPRASLGSTNFIAARDRYGRWGTLSFGDGTTTNGNVLALTLSRNGNIIMGGAFGSVGQKSGVGSGTAAIRLAQYNPVTRTFGTLAGGTMGDSDSNFSVAALATDSAGTLYIGGNFGTIGGGTVARCLAYWDGAAFGTLVGGTITPNSAGDGVSVMLWNAGTLFFAGDFSAAGGTTARFLAQWTGAYGTLGQTAGTPNGTVLALTYGLDNKLYAGGYFGSIGGIAAGRVARWDGEDWGTVGARTGDGFGSSGGGGTVYSLATLPDGRIVAVGKFGTIDDQKVLNAAQFNGAAWTPMGSGLGSASWFVLSARATRDGNALATGFFPNAGSLLLPDAMAIWNGYTWLPLDVDLPSGLIYTSLTGKDNTLYVAGAFNGTAHAASVTTVVNAGQAAAHPTVVMRNIGAGTARIYQLLNTVTNANIYFDLVLQKGEGITFETTPGNRSLESDFRGNVLSAILNGSNLTSFNLAPGTNYISFFADSGSVDVSFYYRARGWSADLGTV